MLIMVGNLLVFAVITVIICTVDLSTITLDESTERLLYEVVREKEKDSQEESTEKEDTGDVTPDIMDFDPQAELDRMTEEAFAETSGGVPEENSFHDLNDVAASVGFEAENIPDTGTSAATGTIDAQALMEKWNEASQADPASDDVGMSADFATDFDTDDVMEDIYNAR